MSDDLLKAGDWVRAQSSHIGKITLVSRLSAFVEVHYEDKIHTMTFLLSELTRIDPPTQQPRPPQH
jgi:hypothetical protein